MGAADESSSSSVDVGGPKPQGIEGDPAQQALVEDVLLELKLVEAQGLKRPKGLGQQKSYCIITPLNQKSEPFDDEVIVSKAAAGGGANPKWNQKALIKLTPDHMPWVNIDIWALRSIRKDSYLGRVRVPLAQVMADGATQQSLPVIKSDGTEMGSLAVELSFVSVKAPAILKSLESKMEQHKEEVMKISDQHHAEMHMSADVVMGMPLPEVVTQAQPVFETAQPPAVESMPSIDRTAPTGGFEKPAPPKFAKPAREDVRKSQQAQRQSTGGAPQSEPQANASSSSAEYARPYRAERHKHGHYHYRPTYHYYYPFIFLFLLVPFFWPFFLFFPFFYF